MPSTPPTYDAGRIVALYRGARPATLRDGRAWYRETAAATLSRVVAASAFRLTRERAAAIVALLSPRCAWRANVARAIDVAARVADGRDPGAVPGAFGYARPLIRRACRADVAPGSVFRPETGPKTAAFYRNLCGDLAPVTVDVWAARAVGAEVADLSDLATYDAVAEAYREAARALGDAPASVQAVAWIAVRRASGALGWQRTFPGFGLPADVVG